MYFEASQLPKERFTISFEQTEKVVKETSNLGGKAVFPAQFSEGPLSQTPCNALVIFQRGAHTPPLSGIRAGGSFKLSPCPQNRTTLEISVPSLKQLLHPLPQHPSSSSSPQETQKNCPHQTQRNPAPPRTPGSSWQHSLSYTFHLGVELEESHSSKEPSSAPRAVPSPCLGWEAPVGLSTLYLVLAGMLVFQRTV